jgi:cell fate regulator YaaT (PSP1 superfamily)
MTDKTEEKTEDKKENKIVGIRFRQAGKVYYFDHGEHELDVNDHVVVETSRGPEIGKVVIAPRQVLASEVSEPLKAVLRKAEAGDIERTRDLEQKAEEALIECGKIVAELGLPMKLLSAEFNLEGNRLTILFSAEQRVDFRELVRRMTRQFKVRLELRQIGTRDEAKLVGGFGRCGRPLCCMSFITDFEPVSIRMAKDQDLPLNPMKISGICGRLMCCLGYENEQYRSMKEKMPRMGQQVSTPMGDAKVMGVNPLKETVMVELESEATVELPLADVSY